MILDLINNLNEEEVTFNKESYKLFKRFILCFFKQNVDKKEIKQIKELHKKITNSNSIENQTEILINSEAYDFIEYALSDINFKDNYDFEEDYYLEKEYLPVFKLMNIKEKNRETYKNFSLSHRL